MSPSPPPTRFTTHTPACDSCRFKKIRCDRKNPRCGNCRKSCTACTFTNRARGNENEDRLGKLEKSLQQLAKAVESRYLQSPAITPISPPSLPTFPDHGQPPDIGSAFRDAAEFEASRLGSNFGKFPQSFKPLMLPTAKTGQRLFHGSISLAAQCFGMRDHLLSQYLTNAPPAATVLLDKCVNQMSNLCKTLQLDQHDYADSFYQGGLLHMPSQQQTEECVEIYFAQTSFPGAFFHPKLFRSRITRFYSNPSSGSEPLLDFCLWYILLQTKPWLTLPPDYHSLDESESSRPPNPFHTFLAAAKNALYKGPTPAIHQCLVINVQAMIVMTLVAIECGQFASAARFLHQACFSAKEMGLTFDEHPSQGLSEEWEEKQLVFCTLYTLDKGLSLTLGRPSDLPSCGQLPLLPDSLLSYFDWGYVAAARASVELAQLHEKTFIQLFSATSRSHDIIERQQCIQRLADQLEVWTATHSIPTDTRLDSSLNFDIHTTQLSYSYHALQVILHGQSLLDSEDKILSHSQSALRLIFEEYGHDMQPRISKTLHLRFLSDALTVVFPVLKHALSSKFADGDSTSSELLAHFARRQYSLQKSPYTNYPPTMMDRVIKLLARLPDSKPANTINSGGLNTPSEFFALNELDYPFPSGTHMNHRGPSPTDIFLGVEDTSYYDSQMLSISGM